MISGSVLTGEFDRYALAPRSGIETTTHWLTDRERVFVIVAAIPFMMVSPDGENVRQEWYAKDAAPVGCSLCAAIQDEASPIKLKQLI